MLLLGTPLKSVGKFHLKQNLHVIESFCNGQGLVGAMPSLAIHALTAKRLENDEVYCGQLKLFAAVVAMMVANDSYTTPIMLNSLYTIFLVFFFLVFLSKKITVLLSIHP